jgi:arylsulfatase A-like enzyme
MRLTLGPDVSSRVAQRTAAVLAAFVVLAGCRPRPEPPPRPPNVLVVTLDTVRADHLSAYGYPVRTSPQLERLAARSTRYARAWATSPWTLPSHASLFTGKHAFEHGARTYPIDQPGNNVRPLHKGHVTLAEALREQGYATAAFVANVAYLGRRWKLHQGFDVYDVQHEMGEARNVDVLAWLASRDERKPFFLFVNYMDAHRPYNARPRPGLLPREVVQDKGALLNQLYKTVMPGKVEAPPDLRQKVVDQYDTAIANLDEELGRLVDAVEAAGPAVVVVTSDHGEYFGEHRLVEHSKDVYEPALRIPLVVRTPGQDAGRVVSTSMSLVDVPRLIADGLPAHVRDALIPHFPYVPGRHPVIAEVYYTRTKDLFHPEWGWRFRRVRTALVDWPFKLIQSSDGAHELHDLARDPAELHDLRADRPEVASGLARTLDALLATRKKAREVKGPVEDEEPLSPEDEEALRALGYVGN